MNRLADLPKSSLYTLIQTRPLMVSERDLIGCLDESRLDPRLMEVCTEHVRDFWWNHHPVLLNRAAKRARFPFMIRAVLAIVLEHCEIPERLAPAFRAFVQTVSAGLKAPAPQLLYAGIHRIGSQSMENVLRDAIPVWRELGLIESSLPFNKGKPGVLKDVSDFPLTVEMEKSRLARRLRDLKAQGLSNEELMARTGMNRVFLSKVINHKLDGISLDYLMSRLGGDLIRT